LLLKLVYFFFVVCLNIELLSFIILS